MWSKYCFLSHDADSAEWYNAVEETEQDASTWHFQFISFVNRWRLYHPAGSQHLIIFCVLRLQESFTIPTLLQTRKMVCIWSQKPDTHKPLASSKLFLELPVSYHLTQAAPKYQYSSSPAHLLCLRKHLSWQGWSPQQASQHQVQMQQKTINETAVEEVWTDYVSFLILVIVLTAWLRHHASSCSLSQAHWVLIIPGIAEELQEKEVTLLLTGLWLDDENTPQGSRKLGLESPFCPWDSGMMSHHSTLQHQSPLSVWP